MSRGDKGAPESPTGCIIILLALIISGQPENAIFTLVKIGDYAMDENGKSKL